MATYRPGKGTVLQMTTGSTTLTTIAQVVTITPPQLANPTVDVTHLQSSWRERLGTIPDGGTVSALLEFDPGDGEHEYLANTAIVATTPVYWRIVFPTTTQKIDFYGCLSAFGIQEVTVDDVLRANITIDCSSNVTISS